MCRASSGLAGVRLGLSLVFALSWLLFFVGSVTPVQAQALQAVVVGGQHQLALDTQGQLWAWGQNTRGQLGDGTQGERRIPVGIGSGFVQVAAGETHSLGVMQNGTLWAWGANGSGQLGDGSSIDRWRPVEIGAAFVQVAAATNTSYGLKVDGSLWLWGGGKDWVPRLLGQGFSRLFAPGTPTHGAVSALKADGSLWALPKESTVCVLSAFCTSDIPLQLPFAAGIAQASLGTWNHFVLRTDGTLWGWGWNSFGELGIESHDQWGEPGLIGQGFEQFASGTHHTLALKTDGSLWAWGDNAQGQLGLGDTETHFGPVEVMRGVRWIAAVDDRSFAIRRDGTLWAWGRNGPSPRVSVLGTGMATSSLRPVPVLQGVAEVRAGLARLVRGGWWDPVACGGPCVQSYWTDFVQVGGDEEASAQQGHRVALKADGSLWAWGNNDYGQVGTGNLAYQEIPVKVGAGFERVSADSLTSLAVKPDGSLWAWGAVWRLPSMPWTPVRPLILPRPTMLLTGVKDVQIHSGRVLVLMRDGNLWASDWVGDPWWSDPATRSNQWVWLGGNVVQASRGWDHVLAIKADGSLWAWGGNSKGQLGVENGNRPTAMTVDAAVRVGGDFAQVSAGDGFSLALKADGSLWAWGSNVYGELGDGTLQNRSTPVLIGRDFVQVEARAGPVALDRNGQLWLWGHPDLTYARWAQDSAFGRARIQDRPAMVQFNAPVLGGMSGRGPSQAQTLAAQLEPAPEHVGQSGHKFLVAVVPNQGMWAYTPEGWVAFEPDSPRAWGMAGLPDASVVLRNFDASAYAGTAFFLGYGLGMTPLQSYQDMMRANRSMRAYLFESRLSP